ncbi:MAG: hypothetical protein ABIH23_22395, partial [bacterium]
GYNEANTYRVPFSIEGSLSGKQPRAILYFRSPQTKQLTINVTDRGGPLNPYLSVTTPEGIQYSDADGGYGDDALIILQDAPEGVYRMDITGQGGTDGPYVATAVASATSTSQIHPSIAFGQTITGQIRSFGDTYAYTFFAYEGQRIEILLTDGDGPLDPYLILWTPNWPEQIADDNSGPDDDALIVIPSAPTTGIYTVIVAGAPVTPTRGAFRLVLAEDRESEQEIQLGSSVSGFIHRAGNRARYRFSNPERLSFQFLLDDYDPSLGTGGTLDPYLKLYDESGSFVSADDNSGLGDDAILVTRLRAGVIEVSGGPTQTIGPYRLRLEERANTVPTLFPGTTMTYVFVREPEVFEFYTHAGSTMYIEVTDQGGSLDPYLRVVGPSGRELARADNGTPPDDDARVVLDAPETGTYTVEVSGARRTFGRAWITFKLLDVG